MNTRTIHGFSFFFVSVNSEERELPPPSRNARPCRATIANGPGGHRRVDHVLFALL